jgi:spore germination cell wall hydrolase CwlJ-like protein
MQVILRALFALVLSLGVDFAKAESLEIASLSNNLSAQEQKDLDCLARNVYFEAGGESFEGKIAVAIVTLNRLASGKFPDSVCEVVHQKSRISTGKLVCQFSWACQSNRLRMHLNERWNQAMAAARLVLLEGYRDPILEDALYFHATYVDPKWGKPKVARIGNHIFYRDRVRKGF